MAKRRAALESDGSGDESYNQDSTPAKRQRVDSESDTSPVRVKNVKKKKQIIQDYEDIDEAELDAQLSAGINLSRIGNDQDDAENEARILDAMSRKEKKKGVSGLFFLDVMWPSSAKAKFLFLLDRVSH